MSESAASAPSRLETAVAAFRRRPDEAAFRALYRQATPKLWALALRMTGDRTRAEDAVQDCWLRAVRGLERFAGRSRFDTWLIGILIRTIREHERADGRFRSPGPHEHETESSVPSGTSGRRAARLDLRRSLPALAPRFRAVLLLHDVYGHTHREIGAMLDIDPGTSKSQLSRARRALRRVLGTATPVVTGDPR